MPLNQKLNVLKTGINEWNHRMENLDETTDVMMGNWGKQTSWMVFGENKMLVWELIDVGGFKERPNWDAKMKYQQMSIKQIKVLFESTWTDNWTFWGNNNPFSFSQSVCQPASQAASSKQRDTHCNLINMKYHLYFNTQTQHHSDAQSAASIWLMWAAGVSSSTLSRINDTSGCLCAVFTFGSKHN